MKNRARSAMIHELRHLQWLESARAMVDRPSAVDAGLTLDDAYAAFATMEDLNLSPLIGTSTAWDEPSVEITAQRMFQVASGLDTFLLHGDSGQKHQAAVRATELVDALPRSTEPGTKQGILANVLGIELPSDVPVEQQLIEQYLLPEGEAEAQVALASLITSHKRTFAS